jgi:hypothetical protein
VNEIGEEVVAEVGAVAHRGIGKELVDRSPFVRRERSSHSDAHHDGGG